MNTVNGIYIKALPVFFSLGLMLCYGQSFAADTPQPTTTPSDSNTVYKSVGPGGETIYSDQPSPDSKAMSVPKTDTYKPIPAPRNFKPYAPSRNQPAKKPVDNTVSISSPKNQATIWSGPGELTVSVSLAKDLGPGQQLEYLIDGKNMLTGTQTSHTFQNVFRGEHVITVRLVDPSGKVLSSEPVTVYLRRPVVKH